MQTKWLALLLAYCYANALIAGTLVVTVKDPSGALIPGAAVRAEGPAGSAQAASTQKDGKVTLSGLTGGMYHVAVQREGFAAFEASVQVSAEGETPLAATLKILTPETAVDVEDKATGSANTDPVYRTLRNGGLAESFVVENLELKRDAGTLTFKTGTVSFTAPVLGRVVTAVFSGRGSFRLTPVIQFEVDHINLMTGNPDIDEQFESAVLQFTDNTYEEMKRSLKTAADGAQHRRACGFTATAPAPSRIPSILR